MTYVGSGIFSKWVSELIAEKGDIPAVDEIDARTTSSEHLVASISGKFNSTNRF
jgi:hypothetical protein